MPDEQLGFFGEATPLDQLGSREVRAGQRGGSAEAASIPDRPEKYADMLRIFSYHSMTDADLQQRFPTIHPGTICKRRLRLERAHLVRQIPNYTRATPHGIQAMVFEITQRGKETLRQWEQQSNGKNPPTSTEGSTPPSSTSSVPPPVSGPSSDVISDTPAGSSTI
jgi:hypothetical protein